MKLYRYRLTTIRAELARHGAGGLWPVEELPGGSAIAGSVCQGGARAEPDQTDAVRVELCETRSRYGA